MAVGYGMLGHVGWDAQNSYGTSKVTSQHFIPFISETFDWQHEPIKETNMYGRFGESPFHAGPRFVEGEIQMESHPIEMGHLLKSVFGQVTTTSAAGTQTHAFLPRNTTDWDDRAAGQPATVEVNRNVGSAALYYDMVGSQLTLQIQNGELLSVTWQGMGAGFTRAIAATPSIPAAKPFRWAQMSCQYNGWAITDMRQATITVNNQLERVFTLGQSNTPYRIKRTGEVMVAVSGVMQFAQHSFWLDFESYTARPFVLNFAGQDTPYNLVLDVPLLAFNKFSPTMGGKGLVEVSFAGNGQFSTTSGTALQATLVNTQTYY